MDVLLTFLRPGTSAKDTRNNRGDYADRWRSAEQPGKYFRANPFLDSIRKFLPEMVEDDSYLNIRTVSFGYSLPAAAAKKIFLGRLRVCANVQDTGFSRCLNYNPEASLDGIIP